METIAKQLLVSYDDARHILGGIGRTTLYERIDSGDLERVNIGRRGFITAESIDAYVASLRAAEGHPDLEALAAQGDSIAAPLRD